MSTKAELEARVGELEANQRELLALMDAVTEATAVKGVRVSAEWDQTTIHITVAGKGVTHEHAVAFAAIYRHATKICNAIMLAADEKLQTPGMSETTPPDAGDAAGGEGGA